MGEKGCGFYAICICLILIGLVINTIVAGWVLAVMWSWFMVPLGLPAISIFHGLGIMTVVGMFLVGVYVAIGKLSNKFKDKAESSEEALILGVVTNLVMPLVYLIILFMGWIYHLLMVAYPNF